ncbi:MAG TPA: ATP-binding protein [Gemmatimonadales bacterium]|nr:ATP-binding protein [Gemmatimonadales bacterium]
MTGPPASPVRETASPDASLRRLAELGRALAGVLRREAVLDLLLQHAHDAWRPLACAVAHLTAEGRPEIVRCNPRDGVISRDLLALARRQGPLLLASGGHPELPVPQSVGNWLLVPLALADRTTGALVVEGPPDCFGPEDLALAEAFAALAAAALESAGLIEAYDAGRRSWRDAVDAVASALCIIDEDESIRRANQAFSDLVGTEPAAVVGRRWRDLVPADWVPGVEQLLVSGGAAPDAELRKGDHAYAVSAVPFASGGRGSVVLLFEDRTERRQLQDQLIQSEKMSAVGQLIAGIAHDLNNPLASVVGFADFLAERPDVPAALREPIGVIREEAERASNIVRSLLSFARKQDRRRQPTALRPLLEATLLLLRNELMAGRVEAVLELEPDLPVPAADANQLQQVFLNLIHNAAQAIAAAGRPGRVVVRARRWLDGVAVDVSDDGPGMSEELAARAFDPFFTTKVEGRGTGLGLSIAQGIVKEHGGRITLTTREGHGATFTVQLPATTPDVSAGADAFPPPSCERLRVLVVDDEPHILHYLRATLEAWGHEVIAAADGDEALDRAVAEPFDVVITDLRMPRLGGREFYETLRSRAPACAARLVFSTGDTVRGDTLAFLESLRRPYLRKPFGLAELRDLLATVHPGT